MRKVLKTLSLGALAGAVLMAAAAVPAEARRGRGHDDHLEGGHRSQHHHKTQKTCIRDKSGDVICSMHDGRRSRHHYNDDHGHRSGHHR